MDYIVEEKKKSFRFIVARSMGSKRTWDTNLLMALEDFEIEEDADEGDDVLITFKLKQYKEYGIKTIKIVQATQHNVPTATTTTTTTTTATTTSTSTRSTDNRTQTAKTYTIKSGDCLWNIAKTYYGDGSKYTVIYNANKTVIENAAKQRGRASSSNGNWIYPGTVLTIPSL